MKLFLSSDPVFCRISIQLLAISQNSNNSFEFCVTIKSKQGEFLPFVWTCINLSIKPLGMPCHLNTVKKGQGVKKLKISINDLLIVFIGYCYGTYELFIENNHRYSSEISGILSFILSTWILISYLRSLKSKHKSIK